MKFSRLVYYIFLIGLIVCPLLQDKLPDGLFILSEYITQFRLQITYLLVFLMIIYGLSKKYLDVFFISMLVVMNLCIIFLPLSLKECSSEAVNSLRVLTYNMYKDNPNRHSIADYITKHDPDIAWIPEMRIKEAHLMMDKLEMEYPYFYPERHQLRSQGSVFISKYPFEVKKSIFSDAENYGPVLHLNLNINYKNIGIFAVHFRSPRSVAHTQTRNKQIQKTIDYINQFHNKKEHFIILGDMNSAFWHPKIKNLRYQLDTQIYNHIFSMNTTWSSHFPEFLQVPIDHIMISQKMCFKDVAKLDAFGSDHHGLLAKIKY